VLESRSNRTHLVAESCSNRNCNRPITTTPHRRRRHIHFTYLLLVPPTGMLCFCIRLDYFIRFLPRDATLARYLLSSCVCPSVRPSQAGIVSKRLAESSWVSARRLPSTYPTLSCKEIRVSPKIMVLPSGSLSQTLDVDNFATASRSCCQQNSSTVELADRTYDASWLVAQSLLHVGRL